MSHTGAGLKWPNDVLHGGRKLAGLLVETVTGSGQTGRLVVGIGLNVAMPRSGSTSRRNMAGLDSISRRRFRCASPCEGLDEFIRRGG